MAMAHEAEIIIPGSFVVLQGNAGDGMSNTIDTVPIEDDEESEFPQNMDHHSQPSPQRDIDHVVDEQEQEGEFHHVENMMCVDEEEHQRNRKIPGKGTPIEATNAAARMTGLAQLTTRPTATPTIAMNRWTHSKSQIHSLAQPQPNASSAQDESFMVVTDKHQQQSTPSMQNPPQQEREQKPQHQSRQQQQQQQQRQQPTSTSSSQRAIEKWKLECRRQEIRLRMEWKEANAEQQLQAQQQQQQQTQQQQRLAELVPLLESFAAPATMRPASSGRARPSNNSSRAAQPSNRNAGNDRPCNIDEDEWWHSQGQVAVFQDVPTTRILPATVTGGNRRRVVFRKVIGTLSPGSTIVATDILYLDSHTLERVAVAPKTTTHGNVHSSHQVYPRGQEGLIQVLKLEYDPRYQSQKELVSDSNTASASAPSHPAHGYAVLSLDGYPLLTPGLPSLYIDPNVWVWRVTCPAGAYVREGLDLVTRHIDTIPYGSLIRVTRKTVNGMGLSRLRVQCIVEDTKISKTTAPAEMAVSTTTTTTTTTTKQPSSLQAQHSWKQQQKARKSHSRVVDGWCSEFLNPLSGQRGIVAQPVPFPVPALYRVTLPVGAVIRKTVELSSAQIGIAPQGAILTIVSRAFSEHPMDKCIERLQLAGNGGWISVRLNRPPPGNDMVVEFIGVDGTFEPEAAGRFHIQASKNVRQENAATAAQAAGADTNLTSNAGLSGSTQPHPGGRGSTGPGDISSIDDSNSHSTSSCHSSSGGAGGAGGNQPTVRRTGSSNSRGAGSGRGVPPPPGGRGSAENYKCLICLTEDRNATIVHGETGHVATCLVCARILKARGDKCPVCRLNIDLVIQQFWA